MRRRNTTKPSELRAEVLDLLLPLQCATRLWKAEIRVDCTPGELAAAFPQGRSVTYVHDDDCGPYALDGYLVEAPGGRLGVRVLSRLSQRECTRSELGELLRAGARKPAQPLEVGP